MNIYFSKTNPNAKIPSKIKENMGYDIYPCFKEDYIRINPNETKMIPTGIASSCDPEYGFIVKERGSTGTKGMAVRAGVIDSGYRNEWFIAITNVSNKKIFISKISNEALEKECDIHPTEYINYPYSKAIAQTILLPVPETDVVEIPYEELINIKSERGFGKLGSSNK